MTFDAHSQKTKDLREDWSNIWGSKFKWFIFCAKYI